MSTAAHKPLEPDPAAPPRRLLYIAPGFLSNRLKKHVRGVQIFDLQLIRQLASNGVHTTILAERTWKARLDEALGDLITPNPTAPMPSSATPSNSSLSSISSNSTSIQNPKSNVQTSPIEVFYTPSLRKPLWNGLAAAALLTLQGRAWDVAYLGNAGEGMAFAAGALARLGRFRCLVLMAHRHPKRRIIALLRRLGSRASALAVSHHIRDLFPPDLRTRCQVRFGEMEHDTFFPRALVPAAAEQSPPDAPRAAARPLRFIVLGALDTPLKDIPTALEAFVALPADLRARCELHLASFANPPAPAALPAGVTAYAWMPPARVPEFLRTMDVMLVTSRSETFCLALVQGMLTGLPALCRSMVTLDEKLDTGAGIPFTTTAELTAAMEKLARDPALRARMGALGRAAALERYCWDTPAFIREVLFPR
ncbi:hypothetical protein BH11PLA1_BH11PLA1_19540 [soil metagenome]